MNDKTLLETAKVILGQLDTLLSHKGKRTAARVRRRDSLMDAYWTLHVMQDIEESYTRLDWYGPDSTKEVSSTREKFSCIGSGSVEWHAARAALSAQIMATLK